MSVPCLPWLWSFNSNYVNRRAPADWYPAYFKVPFNIIVSRVLLNARLQSQLWQKKTLISRRQSSLSHFIHYNFVLTTHEICAFSDLSCTLS